MDKMAGTLRATTLGLAAGALWIGTADAAGNAEVFDLGGKLSPFSYTVMLTAVIVGLVLFDLVVEVYEHYLDHHKGRFHKNLFKKAIKELMILGLISFVLFILKDQAIYDQSDDILTNTFDFVNLFLFFVGVSLVLAAVLIVLATSPLKGRWDTYANIPLKRLLELHGEMAAHDWKWYAAWPPRYFTGLRQAQVLEYHLFRSVFLRLNRSLLTPAFDFSKYSAAIVDEWIVVFFDVGWASWLLAVVVLFFTVPITDPTDESEAVSAHGEFVFGAALVVLELLVLAYCNHAHRKVIARMGVVGGFKGIGAVLQELWVEPKHHMGEETAAIDVRDLLLAAPVKAPTLEQLTSEASGNPQGASQAQVNFKSVRGSSSSSVSGMKRSNGSTGSITGLANQEPSASSSTATVNPPPATTTTTTTKAAPGPAASGNGNKSNNDDASFTPVAATPAGGEKKVEAGGRGAGEDAAAVGGDPLWLPPGRVQNCSMGGDPFILATLRPPQRVVDSLPDVLKGFAIKVGSFWWFNTLFGAGTLLKCYYCAFYFSYAIGRASEEEVSDVLHWMVLIPVTLLLCLLPLAKLTLPMFAQMACLQGQIVWELVSDMEEQQEMAANAREVVLSKLQDTLRVRMEQRRKEGAGAGAAGARLLSLVMDELFEEWDKDGNNLITREELTRGLNKLGVYLSATQTRELFRLADPDHSKSIGPAEFRAFLSDLQTLADEPELLSRQVTLRLQRRAIAEEREHPRVDDCGLLAACAAADGGGGGGGGVARRVGETRRAASMSSVV